MYFTAFFCTHFQTYCKELFSEVALEIQKGEDDTGQRLDTLG